VFLKHLDILICEIGLSYQDTMNLDITLGLYFIENHYDRKMSKEIRMLQMEGIDPFDPEKIGTQEYRKWKNRKEVDTDIEIEDEELDHAREIEELKQQELNRINHTQHHAVQTRSTPQV
jgi:hypothetical protein